MKSEQLEQFNKDELRKCQLKQLDILVCFDQICKEFDLKYWIDSGTLLGAIRHGGFIPWDDDVDVCMLSEDFHKFKQVASSRLPDVFFLQTKETDPSMIQDFIKIRDKNSFFVEYGDDFTKPYNKGIYIDIFEMVEYPSLPKSIIKHLVSKISRSRAILRKSRYFNLHSTLEIPYFLFIFYSLLPIWRFLNLFLSKKNAISYELYDNVGGWAFDKKEIFPLKTISFEGISFSAPNNADYYLTMLYGNYMKLPNEEDRVSHAVYIHSNLVDDER